MPTLPTNPQHAGLAELFTILEASKPGDIPGNRLQDGTEIIYREDGTFIGLRHTETVSYPFWRNRR